MEYSSKETKAGLLVLGALIAFTLFLLTITKIDWERSEHVYTARFGYIGGVDIGAPVRFGGFPVGTVTDMYLAADDNSKIEVKLKVDARTPVRVDSEAFISSIGLMGEYYIEVTTGTHGSDLLTSGSRLRSRDVLTLSQLSEPFMNLSAQLELMLSRVNDLLDEENRERLKRMLAHTDTMLDANASEITGLLQNLNAMALQMKSISERLDNLLERNLATIDTTLLHASGVAGRIDSTLAALNLAANTLNNMATANQAAVGEMLQNFEVASQNFEQFSRALKERPWLLVRKDAPPERKLQ